MHLKTTASCALLFRDVAAMLMKPVIGHSLRELAKFKIPLVGSSTSVCRSTDWDQQRILEMHDAVRPIDT